MMATTVPGDPAGDPVPYRTVGVRCRDRVGRGPGTRGQGPLSEAAPESGDSLSPGPARTPTGSGGAGPDSRRPESPGRAPAGAGHGASESEEAARGLRHWVAVPGRAIMM
eukprot:539470-Hanusia_phi.AAC.1